MYDGAFFASRKREVIKFITEYLPKIKRQWSIDDANKVFTMIEVVNERYWQQIFGEKAFVKGWILTKKYKRSRKY